MSTSVLPSTDGDIQFLLEEVGKIESAVLTTGGMEEITALPSGEVVYREIKRVCNVFFITDTQNALIISRISKMIENVLSVVPISRLIVIKCLAEADVSRSQMEMNFIVEIVERVCRERVDKESLKAIREFVNDTKGVEEVRNHITFLLHAYSSESLQKAVAYFVIDLGQKRDQNKADSLTGVAEKVWGAEKFQNILLELTPKSLESARDWSSESGCNAQDNNRRFG